MSEYIRNQILGIADNFKALASMAGDIEQVARICTDTLKAGNKIMFCGNGGSAADSQHLAAELVGRYKLNRHECAGPDGGYFHPDRRGQ